MAPQDATTDPETAPAEETYERTVRYACYHCGTGLRTAKDTHAECPGCGKLLMLWRARIAFFAGNAAMRRLAEGPATTRDVTRSDATSARPYLEYLEAPSRSSASKRRHGGATSVVYLPGDERAAVRLFIETNLDYVRSCLSCSPNPLQQAWDDVMWQLLLEEWHWLGHHETRDPEEVRA